MNTLTQKQELLTLGAFTAGLSFLATTLLVAFTALKAFLFGASVPVVANYAVALAGTATFVFASLQLAKFTLRTASKVFTS